MKRILIFSHGMELGGAERALIGLLHAIDYSEISVDLFLMHHTGPLMQHIPKNVTLLPRLPQYASIAVPIRDVAKQRQLGVAFGRLIGKLLAKRKNRIEGISSGSAIDLEYSHKYTCRYMPQIGSGEYDLAISFLTPHYFVAEKVQAQKKIAWIHTDYTKIFVDVQSELSMWDKYDYIASISDEVSSCFKAVFPSLGAKLIKIENILPKELILLSANSPCPTDMAPDGAVRLLSVGRFCEAKNFDNIPYICKRILQSGINVKWYIIGFGYGEELIRRKIADAEMDEHVIILGKRENPYPYIASCDVYVQPSRYEGNCVTVHEAQMLGKPVVITRYPTSPSQLKDGFDGIIVPLENDGCADGIISLLSAPELMKTLSSNCLSGDYSNSSEVKKITNLLKI